MLEQRAPKQLTIKKSFMSPRGLRCLRACKVAETSMPKLIPRKSSSHPLRPVLKTFTRTGIHNLHTTISYNNNYFPSCFFGGFACVMLVMMLSLLYGWISPSVVCPFTDPSTGTIIKLPLLAAHNIEMLSCTTIFTKLCDLLTVLFVLRRWRGLSPRCSSLL